MKVRSLCILTVMLAPVCLTPCAVISQDKPSSVTPKAVDDSDEFPWETYSIIAELISRGDAWTTDTPAKQKWLNNTRIALALQKLPPADVERALIVYMVNVQQDNYGPDAFAQWSKAVLILRMMFEMPEDAAIPVRSKPPSFSVAGGVPFEKLEEAPTTWAFPLKWSDGGPELLTVRRSTFMLVQKTYQPHLEYRCLLSRYEFRDLEELLPKGERIDSWTDALQLVEE